MIISVKTFLTGASCTILDISHVSRVLIFPSIVRFLIFENFSTISNFRICLLKFSSCSSFLLYEKSKLDFNKYILIVLLIKSMQSINRVSVMPHSEMYCQLFHTLMYSFSTHKNVKIYQKLWLTLVYILFHSKAVSSA